MYACVHVHVCACVCVCVHVSLRCVCVCVHMICRVIWSVGTEETSEQSEQSITDDIPPNGDEFGEGNHCCIHIFSIHYYLHTTGTENSELDMDIGGGSATEDWSARPKAKEITTKRGLKSN